MLKKIIIIIFFTTLFISCTEKQEFLTGKHWVKYKRNKPNYLVEFTNDGNYINFNKLEKTFTYKIIQNRIIITDAKGEKTKYFIKSLSNNELKLSKIIEVGDADIDYFRHAQEEDYFIGSWLKENSEHYYEISFDGLNEAELKEEVNKYIGKKAMKYSVKDNNILVLNNDKYAYNFSDDLMKLHLVKGDGKELNLSRQK